MRPPYRICCDCGYRNCAHREALAERYARKHEALRGHIGMATVEGPADR